MKLVVPPNSKGYQLTISDKQKNLIVFGAISFDFQPFNFVIDSGGHSKFQKGTVALTKRLRIIPAIGIGKRL